MKYTIYEDPLTHKFAVIRLPYQFLEGDPLPICPTERWFGSHAEALAQLPELLDHEDDGPDPGH